MADSLGTRPYSKGLHDIGHGCYAYLQPDGSWGWSNAGLVVDSGESLLVDTLFDLKLTAEMLKSMRDAEPRAASRISTLANTHSNGDHCFGNQLVEGAEIVASRATAKEMAREGPARLAQMKKAAAQFGPAGEFFSRIFAPFEFDGITPALPTKTFEGALEIRVGNKAVQLIQVGPAHTDGDVIVCDREARTVFTGDILFIHGHPIVWAGPVANWIAACQRMLEMDIETVVPGHGPITDKRGISAVKGYLEYVSVEARKRFDAGMPMGEAARDISLTDYSSWGDAERIVVNVAALYREFSGGKVNPNVTELFALMAGMVTK